MESNMNNLSHPLREGDVVSVRGDLFPLIEYRRTFISDMEIDE